MPKTTTGKNQQRPSVLRVGGLYTAYPRRIRIHASSAWLSGAWNARDACAGYLVTYATYLRYHTALAAGLPIASGVIEGACRSLVADRTGRAGVSR